MRVRSPNASAPIITMSSISMDDFFNALAEAGVARRRADQLAFERVAVSSWRSWQPSEVKVVLTGEGSDELLAATPATVSISSTSDG